MAVAKYQVARGSIVAGPIIAGHRAGSLFGGHGLRLGSFKVNDLFIFLLEGMVLNGFRMF